MVIKYHISPYPALLENMVVKVYEAQAPTAEVYSETLPEKNGSGVPTPGAGHQVKNTITINGLDNVPHIVKLYSAVSVALLHEYNVEPTIDAVTVYSPVRFKVGDGGTNTPLAGQPVCTTPEIAGLTTDQFIIHRKNFGPLYPVTDFNLGGSPGEWVLAGLDVFGDDEEFTIQITPVVTTTYVNDSVVGKLYGGFVDVSSNRDYLASDLRKLIRLANTAEYTFPVGGSIPIGYIHCFTNFGTTGDPANVVKVIFDNAPLKWGTGTKAEIELPLYTEAGFSFDGTNWNVAYISDSRFIENPAGYQEGDFIHSGTVYLGDVASGDPSFTVTHNKAISGAYMVKGTIYHLGATPWKDNTVTWCLYDRQTNSFKICLQEIYPEVQNCQFIWEITKL